MGVAGCGKSAVGGRLAEALGARFIEGDVLHSAENIAKMASGRALDDDDRKSWIESIGNEIAGAQDKQERVIVACSALKRRYRERLRQLNPDLLFLHLVVDPETAAKRVARRPSHFMPASLVESQFQALESLAGDEPGFALDGLRPIEDLVSEALGKLGSLSG